MQRKLMSMSIAVSISILMILIGFGVSAQTPDEWVITPVESEPVDGGRDKAYVTAADGRVRVILQFDGQSSGRTSRSAQVLSQIKTAAPSMSVTNRYERVFDGMSALVDPAELPTLSALDGVTVYPDIVLVPLSVPMVPMLDESLDLIDVDHMWNALGGVDDAGEGMKIAIIDSGIDPTHPMFDDTNYIMPDGYPKGYCETNDGFCNDKVIAARWYGDNGDEPDNADNAETESPMDVMGFGSHVAGIAAGNHNVTANVNGMETTISGVAPRAWLMAYKICWLGADCLASNAIQAVEDAVADDADVINMSLGFGAGNLPTDDATLPLVEAVNYAIEQGVPIVVPAGNDGNGAGTIICPGCVPGAITVGSVTTGRVDAYPVGVTGPGEVDVSLLNIPSFRGNGAEFDDDITGTLVDAEAVMSDNGNGCDTFPAGAFVDDIVLVERGECNFNTKLSNLFAAGAQAAIIFNNQPGQLFNWNTGGSTLPSVLIDNERGLALRERVDDQPTTMITIEDEEQLYTNSEWQNWVANTSSRGPNSISTVLKPDLVAPGSSIISAFADTSDNVLFDIRSGTASAAPFVAGSIAMLLQFYPDWTPEQVKAALIGQSNPDGLLSDDGTTLATPHDRGGGRLDLDRLTDFAVLMDEPSWSDPQCVMTCTWTAVLENITDETITFDATLENVTGGDWTVSPVTPTLDAGETATITVTADVSAIDTLESVFADLVWRDDNESGLTIFATSNPMAVRAFPAETTGFEKVVSPTVLPPEGGTATWELIVRNMSNVTRTVMITDVLPDGMTYESGSLLDSLPADGELTFRVDTVAAEFVAEPLFHFEPTEFQNYQTLSGALDPLDCPFGCDDQAVRVPGLDFIYDGETYDYLYVSSNGFASVVEPAGKVNEPQQFPDIAVPNGVIAPFWTDLDLKTSADDPGSGGMYVGTITTAENSTGWTVIEWHNAAHWANAQPNTTENVIVSFQLWIENGSDKMWFVYGNMENEDVHPSAVGVENLDGTLGGVYWYQKGSEEIGLLPAANSEIAWSFNEYRMSYRTEVDAADALTTLTNVAILHDGVVEQIASETLLIEETIPLAVAVHSMDSHITYTLMQAFFLFLMSSVAVIYLFAKRR